MARGRVVGRSPGGSAPPATEHPGHMITNTARQQTAVPRRFMISPTQFDRGIVGDCGQANSSGGTTHQAFPRTPQVGTSGERRVYPGSHARLFRDRLNESPCLSLPHIRYFEGTRRRRAFLLVRGTPLLSEGPLCRGQSYQEKAKHDNPLTHGNTPFL